MVTIMIYDTVWLFNTLVPGRCGSNINILISESMIQITANCSHLMYNGPGTGFVLSDNKALLKPMQPLIHATTWLHGSKCVIPNEPVSHRVAHISHYLNLITHVSCYICLLVVVGMCEARSPWVPGTTNEKVTNWSEKHNALWILYQLPIQWPGILFFISK